MKTCTIGLQAECEVSIFNAALYVGLSAQFWCVKTLTCQVTVILFLQVLMAMRALALPSAGHQMVCVLYYFMVFICFKFQSTVIQFVIGCEIGPVT